MTSQHDNTNHDFLTATWLGHSECVEILLQHGAKVEGRGKKVCWPGPHSCGLTTSSQHPWRRETPVTSKLLAELPSSIQAGAAGVGDVDDGFMDDVEDNGGDDEDKQCPHCKKMFSRKYDVTRHVEHSCPEAPRKIHKLTAQDLWSLWSENPSSLTYQLGYLRSIKKLLAYNILPAALPKVLSEILNSFKEELREEIIQFPDIKPKHPKRTTLVTVADLEKVIETQVRERRIRQPHITFGFDAGCHKTIGINNSKLIFSNTNLTKHYCRSALCVGSGED